MRNTIFRRLAVLASLMMLLTSTVNTTFGLIVTKTDGVINTFTPFGSVVNDLLISKTVEHPLGEAYVIPDHIAFDFQVDLGAQYANAAIKTSSGDVVADENGSVTVSVKPGKTVAVKGLEAGTTVTVTEILQENGGFTARDGITTKKAIVSENDSTKIEFVNLYTPAAVQPVNVTVGGTKLLEGREWQSGDAFSFTLEQKTDENTWTSLGTKTVIYDAANNEFNQFDFSDLVQTLTFDKVGTYAFRITEVAGDLANMDYDKTVNTFTVKVTDRDMDGNLEIGDVVGAQNTVVTKESNTFRVSVTFNNTFVPPVIPDPEDIAVTVTVNKTVQNTGSAVIGPEGFKFVLENTASGEKKVQKSDADGKAIFTLPFTATDVGKRYTYKLYETSGTMAGVTYDTTVYDITVAVALGADDRLIATVSVNGKAVDAAVVGFENTYDAQRPEAPPTGNNGRNTFWFIMMIVSGAAGLLLMAFAPRRCV